MIKIIKRRAKEIKIAQMHTFRMVDGKETHIVEFEYERFVYFYFTILRFNIKIYLFKKKLKKYENKNS